MWVDGTLIADNDGHHGMQTASGNIDLELRLVSINLEYFENLGGAGLILRWENNLGLGPEIIPAASLFHDSNMVDEDGDGTAIGTITEDWQTVTEFEAGVLYEINLDQDNGNAEQISWCWRSSKCSMWTKTTQFFWITRSINIHCCQWGFYLESLQGS